MFNYYVRKTALNSATISGLPGKTFSDKQAILGEIKSKRPDWWVRESGKSIKVIVNTADVDLEDELQELLPKAPTQSELKAQKAKETREARARTIEQQNKDLIAQNKALIEKIVKVLPENLWHTMNTYNQSYCIRYLLGDNKAFFLFNRRCSDHLRSLEILNNEDFKARVLT